MSDLWKRSRVTKVLVESGTAGSFPDAEAQLAAVRTCVWLDPDQARTAAGQASALTALACAYKCFGFVSLATPVPAQALLHRSPDGATLGEAAVAIGARVDIDIPVETTHVIEIGTCPGWGGWRIACWWDRWLAGVRRDCPGTPGDGRLAFSGVFSGALATRHVFGTVTRPNAYIGDATISLWEPDSYDGGNRGPEQFRFPDNLWLVGLGHLGQAFVWNLVMLPGGHARAAVLQDDDVVNVENLPTSLLVREGEPLGTKKARAGSRWLEFAGWKTDLIERRFDGAFKPGPGDPPYVLGGLDKLPPRILLAAAGFPFMIDAGLGASAGDSDKLQLRVIPAGADVSGLWGAEGREPDASQFDHLEAYRELQRDLGMCGKVRFATASAAVPFVGAAAGALVMGQLARLASMQPGCKLLQLELSAIDMIIDGGLGPHPGANLGSTLVDLQAPT